MAAEGLLEGWVWSLPVKLVLQRCWHPYSCRKRACLCKSLLRWPSEWMFVCIATLINSFERRHQRSDLDETIGDPSPHPLIVITTKPEPASHRDVLPKREIKYEHQIVKSVKGTYLFKAIRMYYRSTGRTAQTNLKE